MPVDRISSLRGQVEEGAGFIGSPEGLAPLSSLVPAHLAHARVTMQRLTTGGIFEDVTKDTATTSLVGVFLVSARVSDQADLVVLAEKDAVRYRTIVTRPTVEDSTITVGPLNKETTVEAELWARVLAGSNGAVTSRISLGLFVEARVATLLSAEPSLLDAAVAPLVGESIGYRAVLTAPNFGVASSLLGPIEAGRRRAAIALEERLDPASENLPATFAAWEAFFAAEREAHVAAGVSLYQLAVAREASARELVRRAAGVRSDLRLELIRAAALQRSRTTAGAVDGTLADSGTPGATRMTIRSAGQTLTNSLYGGPGESQIQDRFDTYGRGVRTALASGFPESSTSIEAAHAAIVAPGGPQSVLITRLSTAGSVFGVEVAYVAYANAAEAAALAILAGSKLPESARVPIARVLTMLAMAV